MVTLQSFRNSRSLSLTMANNPPKFQLNLSAGALRHAKSDAVDGIAERRLAQERCGGGGGAGRRRGAVGRHLHPPLVPLAGQRQRRRPWGEEQARFHLVAGIPGGNFDIIPLSIINYLNTVEFGYCANRILVILISVTVSDCHCPMMFSVRRSFLGPKNCHGSRIITLTGVTVTVWTCI